MNLNRHILLTIPSHLIPVWVLVVTPIKATPAAIVGFQGIGLVSDLPSPDDPTPSISADGRFVAGTETRPVGNDSVTEAFRWSESTGTIHLGDFPGGNFISRATDVTADGSLVTYSS